MDIYTNSSILSIHIILYYYYYGLYTCTIPTILLYIPTINTYTCISTYSISSTVLGIIEYRDPYNLVVWML